MITSTTALSASSLAPATLRCVVVTDFAELQQLRPAWENLLRRSGADEPMLSPAWLLTWWDIYGRNTRRRLCVGCFYEGGRLVGLAPFQSRRVWYRRCLPFRRLEPLGTDDTEGDGVCSEYLNLIIERGKEPQVLGQWVVALLAGQFGRFQEIVVPAMDGTGPMPALLAEACAAAGLHAEVRPASVAPYIPLPAAWDDYLKTLGKNKRYVVKTLRDFETWAAGAATFHRADTPARLEEGQRLLQALHAERWQRAGRDGVFRAGRFAAFHDRVMREFLAQGVLELDWLTVAGEPVAALYSFRWNGKVYFYQAGRKMDVPQGVRPGIVLHAHAIRAALETGAREYDFLAGPAQYKRQLAPAERPLVEFRAVRPGLRERLRRFLEAAAAVARRWRPRRAGKDKAPSGPMPMPE
jgi:CelD/BcsL family acetyltransferase involved in cellulose biosynthesis